ncbi:MAG: MFS transporter [Dehalococcoidia bacterium]|nr:MFS transporter [Dehalococcoidia bacterium]
MNPATTMIGASTPRAGRCEWIGLAVLALACMLYSMDLTVLHLAVPHLSADLQPSSTELLWIVDIYGFMIAGSLITMGALGDRIGRRKLLLIGATAFGLTSILAAFATSPMMLIASRALLGLAGATLAPSTLSLISNMFLDPGQRTRAIGVWMSSFALGGAIGPLVGGVLLEHFWWGSVFLIAVPVMAGLLVLGPILLPEFKDPNAGRIDPWSSLLSLATILPVVYGLKQLASHGVEAEAVLAVVVGLAMGAMFVRRQFTLADPMIDLDLFRIPAFSASLGAYMVSGLVFFGIMLFLAQYLQLVLGLSPLEAGAWSIPPTIVFMVASMGATPAIIKRFPPAAVMSGGLMLSVAGFALFTRIGTDSLALIIAAQTVMMVGVAPAFTLLTTFVIGSAPPERAGAASAMSETGAELGGALGIAVLGSIGTAIYRGQVEGNLPAGIPVEASAAAQDTLGAAVGAAVALPADMGAALTNVASEAFIESIQAVAIFGAAILFAVAVVVGVVLRNVQADGGMHGGPTPSEEPEVPVGEAVSVPVEVV